MLTDRHWFDRISHGAIDNRNSTPRNLECELRSDRGRVVEHPIAMERLCQLAGEVILTNSCHPISGSPLGDESPFLTRNEAPHPIDRTIVTGMQSSRGMGRERMWQRYYDDKGSATVTVVQNDELATSILNPHPTVSKRLHFARRRTPHHSRRSKYVRLIRGFEREQC